MSVTSDTYDVIVVGGSLAGCTAAVLMAREGLRVALIERHDQADHHKRLCTHFIQASAVPVLKRLGLDKLIEAAGGVPNPIEIHTPSGWIGSHLDSDGYNIRRLTLDPLVRQLVSDTPGVTFITGMTARGLVEEQGRITGVTVLSRKGEAKLQARLVVAADGRNSGLAKLAGAAAKSSPNGRFGVLAPLRGVDLQRGQTSQMWLNGPEAAYVFPNDDGVAVIAYMGQKERLDEFRDYPLEMLKHCIRRLPDAPQLRRCMPAGDVLLVKDHANLWRRPSVRGMALVGDALTSVDYMWGVGCGWAFESAAWLADAVSKDLSAGATDLSAALRRYEKRCGALTGHRFLINDFAKRRAFNPFEKLMFSAAAKDMAMARHLNRFGARLDGPGRFLGPVALIKAAVVNLRHGQATVHGTRASLLAPASRKLTSVASRLDSV